MDTDPRLQASVVRENYKNSQRYDQSDDWHRFTAASIRAAIARHWHDLKTGPEHCVLNVGAGNNDLGLCPPHTINLDILESRLSKLPNPLVASVEDLPIANDAIDTAICVGSVINYCDAALAISELGRVVRIGGKLVLEFESSRSAELMAQPAYGRSAAVAESFFAGSPEIVWVYSPDHIKQLLKAAGFAVDRTEPIHIISPWALLLTHGLRFPVLTAKFDPFFRVVPLLSRWASNYLLFCRKRL